MEALAQVGKTASGARKEQQCFSAEKSANKRSVALAISYALGGPAAIVYYLGVPGAATTEAAPSIAACEGRRGSSRPNPPALLLGSKQKQKDIV